MQVKKDYFTCKAELLRMKKKLRISLAYEDLK